MATTKNATYKIYNGTDWDTYYFKTSASQVGESNGSLNFLRPSTHTVNGKSFWSGSAHQGITLYGTDIKISSGSSSTVKSYVDAIGTRLTTAEGNLSSLDTQYTSLKTKVDNIENNMVTDIDAYNLSFSSFQNESGDYDLYDKLSFFGQGSKGDDFHTLGEFAIAVDDAFWTIYDEKGSPNGFASLDTNGKVPTTQLPDSILGQVNYAGIFNTTNATVTLAADDGTDSDTSKTLPTFEQIQDGGLADTYYIPTIGDYFIVGANGTFDSLDLKTGDWLIYNGASRGWGKVDNTDAVSAVAGLTGNISALSLVNKLKGTSSTTLAVGNHTHSDYVTNTTVATDSTLGLVKVGYTPNTSNTQYAVKLSDDNKMYVDLGYQNKNVYLNGSVILDGTGYINLYLSNSNLISFATSYSGGGYSLTPNVDANVRKIYQGSETPTSMRSGDIWISY